jgi:hypothetical protein
VFVYAKGMAETQLKQAYEARGCSNRSLNNECVKYVRFASANGIDGIL